MKTKIFLIVVILFGILNQIIFSQNIACVNTNVCFENSFKFRDAYQWDFGDGITSSLENPCHKYTTIGTYTVTLMAYDNCPEATDTAIQTVVVTDSPIANFIPIPIEGCKPLNVSFTNISISSQAAKYVWDFGDGGKSATDKEPSHTYMKAGNFISKLTVNDVCGNSEISKVISVINVTKPQVQKIIFTPTTNLLTQLPITFSATIKSAGTNPQYIWDFGDCYTSTDINPVHIYSKPGKYCVGLIVSNGNCESLPFSTTIEILPAPIADFTYKINSLFCALTSLQINFTNTSTPNISEATCKTSLTQCIYKNINTSTITTDYLWKFSGCTPSSFSGEIPPPITYSKVGIYQVILVATNSLGYSDSIIKSINVSGCPIQGTLYESQACGGKYVSDDTIVLLDIHHNIVSSVSPAITDVEGAFIFDINQLASLDTSALFILATKSGPSIDNITFHTISEWINQNPLNLRLKQVQANFITNTTGCYADSIFLTSVVSEGFVPFTYQWNFGNGKTSIIENPAVLYYDTGTYTVTLIATDEAGCNDTATTSIFISYPLVVTIDSVSNISCHGLSDGSIDLTVTGGTAPYFYTWSNGATTEDINNLSGENYDVTVTDANGCSANTSVTITEPEPVTLNVTTTDITCNGANNGSIDLTVTGGTPPYIYNWSNGAATEDVTNLAAGTYSVTVTDANGCTNSVSATIAEPDPITLNIVTTNITCNGANDGAIDLTVTGGTQPYTYNWSNGSVTEDINNLTADNYDVTVTDVKGCISVLSVSGKEILTPINGGGYHTAVLCNDGYVWACGLNNKGQLGDGTGINKSIPVEVNGINDIISVATGRLHSLALKADGTVWVWGFNAYGQLGDGTNTDKTEPIQILSLDNIIAISAGDLHSMALKNDGTVWTWGQNSSGQLGNGTTTLQNSPVQVSGLANVIAIAAGSQSNFSMALKADGTVWMWGNNTYGQLGDGTTTGKITPVQAININNVKDIKGGEYHSIALKEDGTVWAWGDNQFGQLGNNTNISSTTPIQVTGLQNISKIASGGFHSLALKSDNTIVAWGYNSQGQLGDGTTTSKNYPVPIVGFSNIANISSGNWHSIALKNDGTVWTWGQNSYGQLGNGTFGSIKVTPVQMQLSCNAVSIPIGAMITEPEPLNVTILNITNETCPSSSDGSIEINATGGTPLYTYFWDAPTAQTTSIATGLTAGNYNVIVYDNNACFNQFPVYINNTNSSCAPSNTISGVLYEFPACSGVSVPYVQIQIVDMNYFPVWGVNPAWTDQNGQFVFDSAELSILDPLQEYRLVCWTIPIKDQGAKLISEWISKSPITLFTENYTNLTYEWVSIYNGVDNKNDIGVALDINNDLYVCGSTTNADYTYDALLLKYNTDGVLQWEAKYNGTTNKSDWFQDIALDNFGNIYVIGMTEDANSISNTLVVKYDMFGNVQWVKEYNAPYGGNDGLKALAIDTSGNIYVTGYSWGGATKMDYITIKYDNNGNEMWVARYNGYTNELDNAVDIVVDVLGNVYVTGNSYNTTTGMDYTTVKYDTYGNQLWVITFDGYNNSENCMEMRIDNNNNIYVTGTTQNQNYNNDYATVKYNSDGIKQWVKFFDRSGINGTEEAIGLDIDANGNVYVTGINYDFVVGEEVIATVKYTSDGVEEWISTFKGNNYGNTPRDIAVDNAGNVYVVGNVLSHFATVKYNTNGVEQWSAIYNYQGKPDYPIAITTDNYGNSYITGWGTVQDNTLDLITLKYNSCPTLPLFKMENIWGKDTASISNKKPEFIFYPNPATNEITIFVQWNKKESYQLRLINLLGQEVLKKDFTAQVTINVSNIRPKGLYFMEVISKEGSFRKMEKVVLE